MEGTEKSSLAKSEKRMAFARGSRPGEGGVAGGPAPGPAEAREAPGPGPGPGTDRRRAEAWWAQSGAAEAAARAGAPESAGGSGGSYADLLRQALAEGGDQARHRAQIELDLLRTFPEDPDFGAADRPMVGKLRRVLTAFAWTSEQGYIQGQNYLAGLTLRVVRDEERSYWILRALCGFLRRYYHESLAQLKEDVDRFSALFAERSPRLAAHIRENGIDDLTLVCPKWFLCAYVNTLPLPVVTRLWDVLLARARDHERFLFEVAIQMLNANQKALLRREGTGELFEGMKALGDRITDPEMFVAKCLDGERNHRLRQRKRARGAEEEPASEFTCHTPPPGARKRPKASPARKPFSPLTNSPAAAGKPAHALMTPMSKTLWAGMQNWMTPTPTPKKKGKTPFGSRPRAQGTPGSRSLFGRANAEGREDARGDAALGEWIEMAPCATWSSVPAPRRGLR